MLPRVKINYQNGALGSFTPSQDGLLAIVTKAQAIIGKFNLNEVYSLRSPKDLEKLGMNVASANSAVNANVAKIIREFYAEAETGTEVLLMGVENNVTLSDMLDKGKGYATKIINEENGRVRGIVACGSGTETETNIVAAIAKGQSFAEWATTEKYAPVFVIIGSPEIKANITTEKCNRVGLMVGDTQKGNGAAVGLLAGRIASIPVQRNIGRVKDGALSPIEMYIGQETVESTDVASIHDRGSITLRTFVGRSGYFFSDDSLATLPEDDYRSLARRRTVDKAYRIVYGVLINELLDEIPVNEDGTLSASMVRTWQGKVESAVARQMTAYGELSSDPGNPNDKGVRCYIDPKQNVLSDSRIVVGVQVRPFGYAKYIDVELGFQTITA